MNNRAAVITIFGLVVISSFFWVPAMLLVCAELLCGGVLGIAASVVIFICGLTLLIYSSKRLWKALKNKVEDPVLQGTSESLVIQNARYIKQAREQGMDDIKITESLLKVGWLQDDVDRAFAKVNNDQLYSLVN